PRTSLEPAHEHHATIVVQLNCELLFPVTPYFYCSFCDCFVALPALHSFPTRRSSDLLTSAATVQGGQSCVRKGPESAWLCRQKIDRKSTRLNSSHDQISYAVFCLKKKMSSRAQCIQSADHPHPNERHACCSVPLRRWI